MANKRALKYDRIGCSPRPACHAILNAKISVADGLHINAKVPFAISEVFALLNESNENETNKNQRRRKTHNMAARWNDFDVRAIDSTYATRKIRQCRKASRLLHALLFIAWHVHECVEMLQNRVANFWQNCGQCCLRNPNIIGRGLLEIPNRHHTHHCQQFLLGRQFTWTRMYTAIWMKWNEWTK